MGRTPIKLPPGQTIPVRSDAEISQLLEQDDVVDLSDVYRGH